MNKSAILLLLLITVYVLLCSHQRRRFRIMGGDAIPSNRLYSSDIMDGIREMQKAAMPIVVCANTIVLPPHGTLADENIRKYNFHQSPVSAFDEFFDDSSGGDLIISSTNHDTDDLSVDRVIDTGGS